MRRERAPSEDAEAFGHFTAAHLVPPHVLLAHKGKQHGALPASWPPWQLCVFSRRGVQLKNPFYSIWTTEVGTELAVSLTGLGQAHVLAVGSWGRRSRPAGAPA